MSIIKKGDGDDGLSRPLIRKGAGLNSLRKQVNAAKAFDEAMSKIADETLVLCIDTSGSMSSMCEYKESGTDSYGYPIYASSPLKIDAARDAAQRLAQASKRSVIGIVCFETSAQLLVEPTSMSNPALTDGFRKLSPAGTTDMAGGINVSTSVLKSSRTKIKRIVLLSDGRPTNFEEDVIRAATDASEASIIIDTVAFGSDADRELLKRIADIGKGVMKEANDAEGLVREFLQLEAGIRGLLSKGDQ